MKQILFRTITMAIILLTGCESKDDRLARFALESGQQQAQQNHDVAEVARQASDNHRRIMEAVESSRQSIHDLERDLQHQRNRLEDERRSIAAARRRESLLASIIDNLGRVLVCSLPLVVCVLLLLGLRRNGDGGMTEILIEELLTHPGIGTASQSGIEHHTEPVADD